MVTPNRKDRTLVTSFDKTAPVSQVVSYSSRFVEKLSDITQLMNISASKSIKSGARFSSADVNAVVSVKVVNHYNSCWLGGIPGRVQLQTHGLRNFPRLFGDSFISSFAEGGELHGIISVSAFNRTQRSTLKSALESALNSATNNKDLTLASSIIADLDSALSESETTISVNWIGGGQIRNEHGHENNKWSLQDLIRAAASFPYPVPPVMGAAATDTADSFARELLDTYMAYKGHMRLLQDALAALESYHKNEAVDAVDVSIRDLGTARKMIRVEMAAIVDAIDRLDKHPERVEAIVAESKVTAPELWAVRLPVKLSSGLKASNAGEV
ncbi:hypothetical protein ASPCAL13653 [Aspergillus calidoustus]|uniref:Uncharacterized protein n=1 Tax=Aspergillus calidoustus TaxID=454130 RepID=A0A0U5GGM1_ASPCI|nr:hypothetical protein ASPCAL13653 [Aspergillus calidoustus]